MTIWLEIPSVVWTDNCVIGFPNFAEILSWIELCPDGVALSSRRSHFSCTQFPYQGLACPDHDICRPDGESDARNFHIWNSRVLTIKTAVRMSEFECATCLMDERIRTGIHIVRTVAVVFPYLCFGKKSHSWLNTEWRLDMLRKRPDRCKLEQFEASRHTGRSGLKVLVIRKNDAWTVEHPDGNPRRPILLQGIQFYWLVDCAESSRNISLKKTSENWLNP